MLFRFRSTGGILILAASLAVPLGAPADEPVAPLKGSDVMDGKNKPGQDGWSWAPTPRDQAASQSGNTPGEQQRKTEQSPPAARQGQARLSPGQDPGTPVQTQSNQR